VNQLHLLSQNERSIFVAEAEIAMGIPFPIIEKDFWVVWTLERLFSLEELKPHLTFKGGTSLSKVYGIINRFSEDIDLSIEKTFFGFDEEKDPENAKSKMKQHRAIKSLSQSCANYVQGKMLTDFKHSIARKMQTEDGWQLVIDPRDPDGQTLQFEYPSIASMYGYIQPSVKIEMGARSEHWPVSDHKVQSYVKQALEDKITEPEVSVRVLNIERTFWEKATILHQYAHLPDSKALPPRISRHYYDFSCLLDSDWKNKISSDHKLLERVVAHKSLYYASSWANYETACKGALKLSPPERIRTALEEDFKKMQQMFFGEIPEWKLILKAIEDFEREFNSAPSQS
jgi:hypothetical protein